MLVLLIDDHPLFRTGLRLLLSDLDVGLEFREADGMRGAVAWPAGDGLESPELVFYGVPDDVATATRLTQGLRARFADAMLVALADVDDVALTRCCVATGACGVIAKCAPPALLLEALRAVLEGQVTLPPSYFEAERGGGDPPPRVEDAIAARVPYDVGGRPLAGGLDSFDQELLWMSLRGLSITRIADHCALARQAVEHRLALAYGGLGARDRVGALTAAALRGLCGLRLPGALHSGS